MTRVAVLSDVHGNATALEAVLSELRDDPPDVVVFGGDVTWGPEPDATIALVEAIELTTVLVRGNSERLLIEGRMETSREVWLAGIHATADAYLTRFVEQSTIDIDGLGPTRFCHGSPRSDEELITPKTPAARLRQLSAGIRERVLVSAHTHLQFDRVHAGIRSINPGSVGMPYATVPGAYWAMLGPDVELRRTEYDVDLAAHRYRLSADPLGERMADMLLSPPTPQEIIEEAERLEFSG
jgi:predicted phosphodiesterase